MNLLVTADLHYNHGKSKALADALIDEVNHESFDVFLLVGDTATPESDTLERCLSRFTHPGPKLFVAGNHELWSLAADTYALYHDELPRRIAAAGWHFLDASPFTLGDVAFVGSVGWYDFAFAQPSLGIPKRFYEHKISPGAAEYLGIHPELFTPADDISPAARQTIARWNDGKFVRLGRSDESFLAELLQTLESHLNQVRTARTVVAAIHHLPFRELLPPPRTPQWDFAKAYLGSPAIGDLLLRYPNVHHLYSGHSHFPAEATLSQLHAINIGSGYRSKTYKTLAL